MNAPLLSQYRAPHFIDYRAILTGFKSGSGFERFSEVENPLPVHLLESGPFIECGPRVNEISHKTAHFHGWLVTWEVRLCCWSRGACRFDFLGQLHVHVIFVAPNSFRKSSRCWWIAPVYRVQYSHSVVWGDLPPFLHKVLAFEQRRIHSTNCNFATFFNSQSTLEARAKSASLFHNRVCSAAASPSLIQGVPSMLQLLPWIPMSLFFWLFDILSSSIETIRGQKSPRICELHPSKVRSHLRWARSLSCVTFVRLESSESRS